MKHDKIGGKTFDSEEYTHARLSYTCIFFFSLPYIICRQNKPARIIGKKKNHSSINFKDVIVKAPAPTLFTEAD